MKNLMKKSLIMTLAVMMTFVFSFSTSFALGDPGDPPEPLKYVAIGSSTANGYGFDGYAHEKSGIRYDEDGTLQNVSASYPRKFETLLGSDGTTVSFTNLCPEGLRTNELRALLDVDYYNENSEDAFLKKHIDEYFCDAFEVATYTDLSEYFKESIGEADVITLDACENNFGSYLAQRIQAVAASDTSFDRYISEIDEVPDNIKALVDKAKTESFELLDSQGALAEMTPLLEKVADALIYCAAACCVNLTADVQEIYELNPDVELIVFGITNPLKNVWIQLDGKAVNLGNFAQTYVDAVNMYIKALDPNSNKYKFADCTECEIMYDAFLGDTYVSDSNIVLTIPEVVSVNIPGLSFKDKDSLISEKTGITTDDDQMIKAQNLKFFGFDYSTIVAGAYGIGSKDYPIDIAKLTGVLENISEEKQAGLISGIKEEITQGSYDSFRILSYLQARFLANDGIGSHPTIKGHEQKYGALVEAYTHEISSRDVVLNQIKDYIEGEFNEKLAEFDNLNLEEKTLGEIDALVQNLPLSDESLEAINSVAGLVGEKLDEFKAYAVEGTKLADVLADLDVENLTVKEIANKLTEAVKADAKAAAAYTQEEYGIDLVAVGDVLMNALVANTENFANAFAEWVEENFEATLNAVNVAANNIADAAIDDTVNAAEAAFNNAVEYLLEGEEVSQAIDNLNAEKAIEVYNWFKTLISLWDDGQYEDAAKMVYEISAAGFEYIMDETEDQREAFTGELSKEAYAYYIAVADQANEDVDAVVTSVMNIANSGKITKEDINGLVDAITNLDFTETMNVIGEDFPVIIKDSELVKAYANTLNTVYDEGQKVYAALSSDLEKIGAAIKAQYDNYVEQIKALKSQAEQVLADMIKCYEELEKHVLAKAEELELKEKLEAAIDEMTKAVDNYEQILDCIEKHIDTQKGVIIAKYNEAVAQLKDLVEYEIENFKHLYFFLTHTVYYLDEEESYYVALGGTTAKAGYPDLLAEELKLSSDKYKNLGKADLTPNKLLDYIQEKAGEIEKADLITYQMDAMNLIDVESIFSAYFLSEGPDWTKYFTEEQLAEAEKIQNVAFEIYKKVLEAVESDLAELDKQDEYAGKVKAFAEKELGVYYTKEVEAVIDEIITYCFDNSKEFLENTKEVMSYASIAGILGRPLLESLVYSGFAYAIETQKAITAIKTINPDAELIVVGMYNPIKGLEIELGEGNTVDLGKYMDYVVYATNVYYTCLAVSEDLIKDFTFVPVEETTTESMQADAAGQEYIANAIRDAIYVPVNGIGMLAAKTMTVGQEFQLTTTVKPSCANCKYLTFESSDDSVATVDKNGLVKAVGKGTATITATAINGVFSNCVVTVSNPSYGPSYYYGGTIEKEKTLEEKIKEAQDELNKAIADNEFKARSEMSKLNGKKAVKLSWTKVEGADGYEIFRSTKRYSGFGTKPFFTTTKTTYKNNKDLKKGKTYYYKVRAYKLVEGQKVYSDWSLKAWRTIEK